MIEFRYRADIDGLRAVAVLMVLLFHADLGFTGGFVGVDIFFVISGFLITGLILKQQEADQFKLSTFWMRRIKRILPASFLMVFTTLIAGYFLLLPIDFIELGESLVAQQLLVSNVFFWRNTGYFDGAAEIKPLLHTWSLAIEEQFYLFYPFLLVLLRKWKRKSLGLLLLMGTLFSYLICQIGMAVNPNATFFLLPTRAWELSLGGLIWFAPLPRVHRRSLIECLSFLGIGGIFASSLGFDSNTPFPGNAALLPTLATVVLIYANGACETLIGRLLSLKTVVFVGLISYSLYLWHWPILAYARYWFGSELPPELAIGALLLAAVISVLSYHYVETPIRRVDFGKRQRFVVPSILAVTPVLILLASVIRFQNGIPWRVPESARLYDLSRKSEVFSHEVFVEHMQSNAVPVFGDPAGKTTCLIWGDSHAMSFVAGLDAACRDCGIKGLQLTRAMTPPLLGMEVKTKMNVTVTVPQYNQEVLQYIDRHPVDLVILAGHWKLYSDDPKFRESLQRTIDALDQRGQPFAILRDVASKDFDVPRMLAQQAWRTKSDRTVGFVYDEYKTANQKFEEAISERSSLEFVILDPSPFFVDQNGFWPGEIDQVSMYRDDNHLSQEGSLRLTPMFTEYFKSQLKKKPDSLHASDEGS